MAMYDSLGSLMSQALTAWQNCDPQTVLNHLEQKDLGMWLLRKARSAQRQVYDLPNEAMRFNMWSEMKYETLFPNYTKTAPRQVIAKMRMLLRSVNPQAEIHSALQAENLSYLWNPENPKPYSEQ